MKLKRAFFFSVGLLLTLPLAYLLVDRVDFMLSSKMVLSTVQHISASNGHCGGRRLRHDCTEYKAILGYRVDGTMYKLSVRAGRARGHDRPIHDARHRIDQLVKVAYDVRNPARAYRQSFWDIWNMPVATLICQICAFVGSFNERRGGLETHTVIDRSYVATRFGRHSPRR